MEGITPREEVDYATLYKNFLTRDTSLPLNLFDSRVGEVPRCRLPFPPERSGFSWTSRLERAREEIPRAVFRPTRPKIYKRTADQANQNVTVLALEIPQKRGRGRPKKDSTVLVDAAAMNRNNFFVKRTYKNESDDPGTSVGVHTIENYHLHGHGGADVDVHEIGIIRPERHYLRNNSIKIDDFCEYDLDDQDVEWLKLVKSTAEEMQLLSEDVMERVIEELEQGWNVLTQPIRKLQQRKEAAMFPDEVPCEICGDCDTSNCNVIVLCDDCDLAVHQECYGVPHIPEGPWICRACTEKKVIGNFKPKCMLCPWPGGALRKTTDHRWVHSLCAHLVPETSITFTPSDPYDLVDVCTLQADRAKLRCVLCRGDCKSDAFGNGYPIQCSIKMCHVAFHPMCARAAGWKVEYSNQKAYCCRHTPENSEHVDITGTAESEEPKIKLRLNFGSLSPSKTSKYPSVEIGENCPLHVTRGGEKLRIPTFAPQVLISHISGNERVFKSSDVPEPLRFKIVQKISKYWALKRESRKGTPLLKSLQLEPSWSQTDAMSEEAFSQEWTDKMSLVKSLRSLKLKVSLLRQREVSKLQSLEASVEIFSILSSPFSKILEKLISKLQVEVDRPGYFAYPVPCDLFPDYPMIVQYPMDFSTILKNLRADLSGGNDGQLFYPTLLHFYADLKLIWENSRLYNTKTSVFYQAADRLEAVSKVLLTEIWMKFKCFGIEGPFDILKFDGEGNSDSLINFDEIELPECTPARFPKPFVTPISESADATTGNSNGNLKRRGRPPKRRDGPSGSIDSIASNADGQLQNENVKEPKTRKEETSKVPKKRGRPPKQRKSDVSLEKDYEKDFGKDLEEGEISVDDENLEKQLFWVRMKNGNWCPGELFREDSTKRRKTGLITVRLFDAFKTVLSVGETDLKALTEDFEADLESLEIDGIASKKWLASAHRSALLSLKK